MNRILLLLAMASSLPSLCGATSISPPTNFSRSSASGAFTAHARVEGGWHVRIEVYGPFAGQLFWAAKLDAYDYVTEMQVTDQGSVFATFLGGDFRMFTSTGKSGPSVRLYAEYTAAERELLGAWSPAASLGNYLKRGTWTEGGKSWLYLRTAWGHIFPFDCASGDLDRDAALAGRIEASMIAETRAWLATGPVSFASHCPSCGGPCLDPEVIDRLFVVRTHRLAEGEPVLRAALAARTAGHDDWLKDALDRVYDPEPSVAARLRGIDLRVPIVGLILFLSATVWFMWKRAGRN